MNFLPCIYFSYMFISLYFLIFFLILYVQGKSDLYKYLKLKKNLSVSVVVPAYNEGKTIEQAIIAIFNSDYKNIKEVIVVDDASSDNTAEVLKRLSKKYLKLKVIRNKKNLGNAARSQNVGLREATGDIVAVIDGDSYPAKEAIRKMIGFFSDEKVGAVTCPILVRNKNTFFAKIQAIEYGIISVTRKLLEFVGAIYVTPGPLALYRKKALDEIDGFDENNLTQDIEATWHLAAIGWKRKMCLSTKVTSTVPLKFLEWYKQRERWSIGGMQTIIKYKSYFFKKGIVGCFILPFFVLSTFLGLFGTGIFVYLFLSNIINTWLFVQFSYVASTPLLTASSFYFTLSILNYIGIVLFVLSGFFTFLFLFIIKDNLLKKTNIFNIFFFMIVYLLLFPIVLVTAIFKLLRGSIEWR